MLKENLAPLPTAKEGETILLDSEAPVPMHPKKKSCAPDSVMPSTMQKSLRDMAQQ